MLLYTFCPSVRPVPIFKNGTSLFFHHSTKNFIRFIEFKMSWIGEDEFRNPRLDRSLPSSTSIFLFKSTESSSGSRSLNVGLVKTFEMRYDKHRQKLTESRAARRKNSLKLISFNRNAVILVCVFLCISVYLIIVLENAP